MRATTEALEGNKVRLSVEVDEPEVDKVLDEAVRTLSRQVRIPGFRPGKVPGGSSRRAWAGPVALRAEALREALPDFYARAVVDTEVDPIAPPEIDITAGEESGARRLRRPGRGAAPRGHPRLRRPAGHRALASGDRRGGRRPDRPDARPGRRAREVSRPAIDRDHVTIDLRGHRARWRGGRHRGRLPLRDGQRDRWSTELDEQLRGAEARRHADVHGSAPGWAGALLPRAREGREGEEASPRSTDEWAAESSEFATVEELRTDLSARIGRVKKLADPDGLAQTTPWAPWSSWSTTTRCPRCWWTTRCSSASTTSATASRSSGSVSPQFLEATGRTGDELVAELRVDALRAVKADLALRALAEAEDARGDDEELDAELDAMAERMEVTPDGAASAARPRRQDSARYARSSGRPRR